MRAVKISLRLAEHLRDICKQHEYPYAVLDLETAMRVKTKRSIKASRARKTTKRLTKKEETSAIREAVMKRADNRCECGCGLGFEGEAWRSFGNEAEMDHFFPKARTRQTLQTCWALTRHCHRNKTRNWPSREHWLRAFADHCAKHGYSAERIKALNEICSEELVSEAAALSRGEP